MTSLRLKIFLALGLLVVAAVGLVGILSRGVTRTGVHRIVELEEAREREEDLALADTLRRDLERLWSRDGGFESAAGALAAFEVATGGASGVALFDAEAELVAGSGTPDGVVDARPLGGGEAGGVEARWTVEEDGRTETLALRGGLPVRAPDGAVVGTLLPIPRPSPERAADRREALLRLDRRLLAAVAGVAALALLLGGLLARRIVRPVEALAAAARDLGAGDLGRRVDVASNDELGRLGRAFNDMAAALERAEDLRRRLVADVAHELRTPLAALRAQLEALQDGLTRPTPQTIGSLVEDAVHLGGLVDDLQDLALADAGRLPLDRRPLDLEREVRAAARSLGLESGEGLRLELGDLPPVHADPRRLRQILHNLLDNARVHGGSGTPERPIEILACALEPGSDGADRAGMIRLTVRDHGSGVPVEHVPHLFERFHRPDPSRARATGGAGLGLAITRALVELHGGTIRAADAPGGGLAVTLALPLAPPRRPSPR
ncbi:MAG: ATP-binding protein [Acidobacteriota bacterium]